MKQGGILRNGRDSYRLGPIIGRGGFGVVYECFRSADPHSSLAAKLTRDRDSWVTELYFERLTRSVPAGVLRIWDAFPTYVRSTGSTVYVIVEDRAACTLLDLIGGSPRPESWVVKQFRTLLLVLEQLHAGGAVHRDLTPGNIFADDRDNLMVGDFGIAFHKFKGKGPRASKFAPYYCPPEVMSAATFTWSPRQDVWQMGQLLAMALLGSDEPIKPGEVRSIACSDWLAELIYRSISKEQHRFEDARRMRRAMEERVVAATLLTWARRPALKGRKIVFTAGIRDMPRLKAEALARHRGAHVLHDVTFDTDYLVVGGKSNLWATGSAGSKIMEAVVKNEKGGANICFITSTQFLRLVGR